MSATAEMHYGLTPPERLRAAVGSLAACGERGEAVRTTSLLDAVTCHDCRDAVESGAVAVWEVEAGMIEARFRRRVAGLRRRLAVEIAKVVAVVVVLAVATVWLLVVIWR